MAMTTKKPTSIDSFDLVQTISTFLNNKVRVHDARAALEYSKDPDSRPNNSILELKG